MQRLATFSSSRAVILGLLLLTYTFNFIDRTIIGIIGQAIKVDLGLSDTQLGLLGGFSFALLYTFLGIPIARLAERWDRVSIISVSLVIWSGFTAACGFAQNFLQLLAMRVGVGIGEAGGSPPAISLISDYFEPRKRATALSIYSCGIPLGSMFGAMAGGWMTDSFDWRAALVIVGLPGILLAIIVRLVIVDPRHCYASPTVITPRTAAPFSLRSEVIELRVVAQRLFGKGPTLNITVGTTLTSIATYGSATFSAPYFVRVFDLTYTEVGMIVGIVVGISAGSGTLLGGLVADRAGRRDVRWYALVPAIGLTIATPIYALAYMQQSWQATAAILLVPGVFAYSCVGPTYGIIQNAVESGQRATAAALLLFVINFVGLGFGPLLTGWLIDTFAQIAFAEASTGAMDNFGSMCPGGIAPSGTSAQFGRRCATALVEGTRLGIVATLAFHLWAAFHYFLASKKLGAQLGDLSGNAAYRTDEVDHADRD